MGAPLLSGSQQCRRSIVSQCLEFRSQMCLFFKRISNNSFLSRSFYFLYTSLFPFFFERKNNSISRSAYWNILKAVYEDELKRPACWSQVLTFCLRAKSIRKVSYYYREEARAPAYYKSIEQASHWLWLKRVSWHRNFQFEASWHRLESCLLWCLPQHQHLDWKSESENKNWSNHPRTQL